MSRQISKRKKGDDKKNQKGWFQMGLVILGWSIIIIGLVIAIWGMIDFPISEWLGPDFLSLIVSSFVLITGGLAVLTAPAWMTISGIVLTTLFVFGYIWQIQMETAMTVISYIILGALAAWLISLFF